MNIAGIPFRFEKKVVFAIFSVVCVLVGGLKLGLVFAASLLIATVVHEVGHAVTIIATGNEIQEVVISGASGGYVKWNFDENVVKDKELLLVSAAGSTFNLILAGISGAMFFLLPIMLIPTAVSLAMGIYNLLPISNLDGAKILSKSLEMVGYDKFTSSVIQETIGYGVGFSFILTAIFLSSPFLAAIGILLTFLHYFQI